MSEQKKQIQTTGYFGQFGGSFVPPQLEPVLQELSRQYQEQSQSAQFQHQLQKYYTEYIGRPSLLYFAARLTQEIGGAKIYLKREDLNHTGAHKINNTIGQGLLAQKMGKKKLIAETGAGQHGVATATVAALLGMECDVYMGARDMKNQAMNVYRMELLGAKVIPVTQGQGTLKDAVDVALQALIEDPTVYYMLGSVVGPHPYPTMVRDFQKVIGQEVRQQILEQEQRLPDALIACIGGGSNAMGLFYEFIDDSAIQLIGVEPAGEGENSKRHGLALKKGKPGLIHGFRCQLLQDETGQIAESYSAASGLDYPGVGPEPSYLAEIGRLTLSSATDQEAVTAFIKLSETEGIIPALESAHALVEAFKVAQRLGPEGVVVVNLSGRGDKDVQNVVENLLP